jgi:hypothetical protein
MARAILEPTEIHPLENDEIHADSRNLDSGHGISGLGNGKIRRGRNWWFRCVRDGARWGGYGSELFVELRGEPILGLRCGEASSPELEGDEEQDESADTHHHSSDCSDDYPELHRATLATGPGRGLSGARRLVVRRG